MRTAHYPNDTLDDLLALGADVLTSAPCARQVPYSPRDAARSLVGVVSWIQRKVGVPGMQSALAKLVRHTDAWRPDVQFRDLPVESDGTVDEYVAMVAVFASGLLHIFAPATLRSAMAFWATERDVAVWREVCSA